MESSRLAHFLVVGAGNTFFHILVFSLLSQALDSITICYGLSWLVSIPVAYVSQSKFVWMQNTDAIRFLRFCASYIPPILLSVFVIVALENTLRDAIIFELIGLAIVGIYSFSIQKYWVFK